MLQLLFLMLLMLLLLFADVVAPVDVVAVKTFLVVLSLLGNTHKNQSTLKKSYKSEHFSQEP